MKIRGEIVVLKAFVNSSLKFHKLRLSVHRVGYSLSFNKSSGSKKGADQLGYLPKFITHVLLLFDNFQNSLGAMTRIILMRFLYRNLHL